MLYSISFGRVLIHQAINANVGNLKTFKPLFISLAANRFCSKLNEKPEKCVSSLSMKSHDLVDPHIGNQGEEKELTEADYSYCETKLTVIS